jgi:phage terminase large subunit
MRQHKFTFQDDPDRFRVVAGEHCHYQAFPRQVHFHRSGSLYRLFGGAAGPGKTKALLWEAIFQAHKVPRSDSLLLRRTYPELESSLLAYFRRDVPRPLYKSYNEAKHVVTWKNDSTTRFGFCRNENDVYRYQGAEFLFIGLDELTHFTLKQWQFLTSRNRCPVKGSKPCMAGASNPGNVGHAWVKALWVDHTPPPGYERPELYNPGDYDFIRARLDDNPIYANDVEYRRKLETLPEHLRRAFLDGDWNVFAGQYFDVFDVGRHTVRPEDLRLEPWWPRWISIDWGFQHPSAVYWHCAIPKPVSRDSWFVTRAGPQSEGAFHESPVTSHQPAPLLTGSRIVTYREFVQTGLSPRMLAQAIAERSGRERISEIFLSPDAFAHRTSEASIAEQLGDVLVMNGLPRPAPADDDRIGGWQLMYQLLESDSWLITENCAKLIECLPQLVRDNHRVEDIRKVDGDDLADAARYGLVSGGRIAGVGAWPARLGGHIQPGATQESPNFSGASGSAASPGASGVTSVPGVVGGRFGASQSGNTSAKFVTGRPLSEQIKRQITATDPTSVAIHSQRLETEARKQLKPKPLPRRRK